MISKQIVISYLKSYLALIQDRHHSESENFFISFCDVDNEIFSILNDDTAILNNGIDVIYLKEDEYFSAVQMRNNNKKKKIIILTSKSIKHIDSLKHYQEYPILISASVFMDESRKNPANFASIIFHMCHASFPPSSKEEKEYAKFFDIIIQNRQPSLLQLLDYATSSLNGNNFDNKKLNANLFMLGCWSISDEALSTIPKLKKIIRNSDSVEIINRLENANNKKIRKYVYDRDFDSLIKNVPYSKVENYFAKVDSGRNNKPRTSNESSVQWHFSYDAFLNDNEQRETIETYENTELSPLFDGNEESNPDQIAVGENPHLIELLKRHENYLKHFENYIPGQENISNLCKKINVQCQHAEKIKKNTLEKLLRKLEEEYAKFLEYLCKNVNNMGIPFLLNDFTKNGQCFASKYIEVLQFLFTNDQFLKILSPSGLTEELQNIFIKMDNGVCMMPFYHPIFILYLCKMKKLYTILLEKISSVRNEIETDLLNVAMESLKNDFPVQTLYRHNDSQKLYQLDTRLDNLPYYVQFSPANGNSSLNSVDTGLFFDQIYHFIQEHTYINQLKVLVLGDLDLYNVRNYEGKIRKYVENEDNLLENLILTLAPGDIKEMREQLDNIYSNETMMEKIKFRFFNEHIKGNLKSATNKQHLVVFLDPQILYVDPYFEEKRINANIITGYLKENSLEDFLDDLINHHDNNFPLLWEGLQNTFENPTVKLGKWCSNQIDSTILKDIKETVDQRDGFKITVFSSNTDVQMSIGFQDYISFSPLGNRGKELVCMDFSQSVHTDNTDHEDNSARCLLPLYIIPSTDGKEEFDLFGSDISDKFLIQIQVLGNQLGIKVLLPTSYEDDVPPKEHQEIIQQLLTYLFPSKPDIFVNVLKQACLFQAYSYCRSYRDVFLCNYIQYKFQYNKDMGNLISYTKGSPLQSGFDYYKAKKTTEFLVGHEDFSEGSISDFQSFFGEPTSLFDIQCEAEKFSSIDATYETKIKKLIKGVEEYNGR